MIFKIEYIKYKKKKIMKYVKTFENFNYEPTNEGFLWGEGSIWSKLGSMWKNWKSKKMQEGAQKFEAAVQKNPKVKEYWDKNVQPVFDKLTSADVEALSAKTQSFKGDEPPADLSKSTEELVAVQAQKESLKGHKVGTKIYEAYSLILEEMEDKKASTAKRIVTWLGIGAQYTGAISAILGIVLFMVNTGLIIAAGTGAVILAGPLMIGMIFGGLALAIAGLIALKGKTKEELRKEGSL